ncbi:MAG TPA: hypothetical protein VFL59_16635 [Candidatus Nanopelagicales bacterium]|nr:hypothetical protein [Candidatus Nanopelagicales bacterium]
MKPTREGHGHLARAGATRIDTARRTTDDRGEVVSFLDRASAREARRAMEGHVLLRELTRDHLCLLREHREQGLAG